MKRPAKYQGRMLDQFAVLGRSATGNGFSASADTSRRKKKHEMLLTFIEHANAKRPQPAPPRPRILHTLLPLFF